MSPARSLLFILATLFLGNSAWAESPPSFLLKWGSPGGSGDGQVNDPIGVAVDPSGNVYVADTDNNRIQKFTSSGVFLTKWGFYGNGDGQFNSPTGVAVDGSGNVYVADYYNDRIQKFTSSGTFLTKWGSPGSGDGQFSGPRGVAVDGSGNVYVTETNSTNDRIQKFSSSGVFLTKWGSHGSGDGQFSAPYGIAVDGGGNVYVSDAPNNRIQKFTSSGVFLTKWGSYGTGDGQFIGLEGVAVDASGNVYVTEVGFPNYRIQKFTSSGAFLTKWGSPGSGDGQFDSPEGVAVDGRGNVYVSDSSNDRMQKFGIVPNGRYVHTAIYDPVRNRMLVFGGLEASGPYYGYANDVWALSLSGTLSWSKLAPTGTLPSARQGQSAIYDAARDRMVIFGGYDGTSYQNDVWALSLSGTPSWSQISAAGSPPDPRIEHTAIYDPVRNRMLIFGGQSPFPSYRNDTWALSLSGTPTWSELSPGGTPPSGRLEHTAIYDPVRDRMVVFGGNSGGPALTDTWGLTLSGTPSWSELSPAGTLPIQRLDHSAIYDQARDRMLVFGGLDNVGSDELNDTWALSLSAGGSWSQISAMGPLPDRRSGHTAVYDPVVDRMIVFGGFSADGSLHNDTWALSLSGTPTWSELGVGAACQVPTITEPRADTFWLTGEPRVFRVTWNLGDPCVDHVDLYYAVASRGGSPDWRRLASDAPAQGGFWQGSPEDPIPAADTVGARVMLVAQAANGLSIGDPAYSPNFAVGNHRSIRLDVQRLSHSVFSPPILFWNTVSGAARYDVYVTAHPLTSCARFDWATTVNAPRTWIPFDRPLWEDAPASRYDVEVDAYDAADRFLGTASDGLQNFVRFKLSDLDPNNTEPYTSKPPVILVHGWTGNQSAWYKCDQSPLINGLINSGGRDGERFHPWALEYPNIGPIEHSAAGLAAAVTYLLAQPTPADSVRLVAHSMGGLVCRAYLERLAVDPANAPDAGPTLPGPARVSHLVTLSSPLMGEPGAAVDDAAFFKTAVCHSIVPSKSVEELDSHSRFIGKLNKTQLPRIRYLFTAGTDYPAETDWGIGTLRHRWFVRACPLGDDATVDLCSARGDCGGDPRVFGTAPMLPSDAVVVRAQYALCHSRMSRPGVTIANCSQGTSYDPIPASDSRRLLSDILGFLRCGPCLASADCPARPVRGIKHRVVAKMTGGSTQHTTANIAIQYQAAIDPGVPISGASVSVSPPHPEPDGLHR